METGRKLADGKSNPGEVVAAAVAGKNVGESFVKPVTFGINKLEQLHRGRQVSKEILSGGMDKQLGLNNIQGGVSQVPPVPPGGVPDPDVDMSSVESKMDDKQQIYREALARYAKVAARSGKDAAEIAYYEYLEKNIEK